MTKIVKLKNGCSIQTTAEDVKNNPIIKMFLTVNKTEIVESIEVGGSL